MEATGPDNAVVSSATLAGSLRPLGATLVSTTDTFGYRTAAASVVARVEGHHVVVSATTDCPQ